MFLMARLCRLVWLFRVGVLLVDGRPELLVRLGKGMELKGLRAVWRGRDIGLLGGLEGCISFVFFWCALRILVFVIPPTAALLRLFSLRCSHAISG